MMLSMGFKLVASALLLCSTSILAQQHDSTIDQISSPREVDPVETSARLPARLVQSNTSEVQLSSEKLLTDQLTDRSHGASSTPQLNNSGRTAQPSAALSWPIDGRSGAINRVVGVDRCDPSRRHPLAGQSVCLQAIETRAAEFTPAEAAPLSAEQRILSEQRTREINSPEAAARRLASNASNPDSAEDQAVAAIILRDGQTTVQTQEELREEVPAAAAALINILMGDPPQP